MKYTFFFKASQLAFLFLFQSTFGQGDQNSIAPSAYITQLTPNNPDMANIEKFGNIPVNQYNGTANIAVPIHSIDFDGIAIDIAANYNTSGIRVEQEASWIGLGWSLNEGYSISRSIQGFDDLNSSEFDYRNLGWIYSQVYLKFNSQQYYEIQIAPDDFENLSHSYTNNRPHDTEPDIFTIKLPNGSVDFYLPKIQGSESHLVASVMTEKNYKVLYDINNKTFTVTDPSGFVYDFNVLERSTSYSNWDTPEATTELFALQGIPTWSTKQTKKIIMTWKLEKITSPIGRILQFNYEDGFHFSFPHFSEKTNVNIPGSTGSINHSTSNISTSLNTSASLTAFYTKYLTSIEGDFGSVQYQKSDRLDLSSDQTIRDLAGNNWHPDNTASFSSKKLSAILVKDPNNNIVRQANFSYSYFNNDELVNPSIMINEQYVRLKLDEIAVNGLKYSFQYIQPNDLPIKSSKSVDFWGFYNGISNTKRIPTSNRFYQTNGRTVAERLQWFAIKHVGANRKSDIQFGQNGLLNKITYPTGGSTQFEYEGNTISVKKPYYIPGFYSDGGLKNTNLNSSESYNFRYQYLKLANDPSYHFYDNAYIASSCDVLEEPLNSGEVFQITPEQLCTGQTHNFSIEIRLACATGCGLNTPNGNAVWLENMNTGSIQVLARFQDYTFNNSTPILLPLQELQLTSGTYRIQKVNWVSPNNSTIITSTIHSAYSYIDNSISQDPPAEEFEEFEVGGARIKKMVSKDEYGNFATGTSYSYNQEQTNGTISSSGILMDNLVYTSSGYSNYEYTPEYFSDACHQCQSSGSYLHSDNMLRTSNAAQGSHIGYSEVTQRTINSSDEDIGWSTSAFVNEPNEYIARDVGISYVFTSGGNGAPAINTAAYYHMIYSNTWSNYYNGRQVMYGKTYVIGAPVIDFSHKNGSVSQMKVYSKAGELVSKSENFYQEFSNSAPFTYYPKPLYFGATNSIFHPYEMIYNTELKTGLYQKQKRTVSTDYFDGNAIANETEYFYDNFEHNMPTRVVSKTSDDNKRLIQKTAYSQDVSLSEPYINNLIASNQFTIPVQRDTYQEDSGVEELLTSNKIIFGSFSGTILAHKMQSRKGDGSPPSSFEDRYIYHNYDNFGNPLEISQPDGTHTCYIWGYQQKYPIAKIENATYSQVASHVVNLQNLSNSDDDQTIGSSGNEGALRTALEALRNSTGLAKAFITTYTYDPLIGVTSTTDPSGYTSYFEYDDSNRLKYVRDEDGNILSKNEYNYVNQN